MESYYMTDCGKLREINEDAGGVFWNKANQLVAIVADGMGGHQAGEVASELAVEIVREAWENSEEIHTIIDAELWMRTIFTKMNETIFAQSLQNDALKGMGTTAVVALCTDQFITIGHIGDSRCYLLTNEHQLKQLTSDHTLVNELIRTGEIDEQDAKDHPRKNVLLKAVGTEKSIDPDVFTFHWQEKNRLLLCSDGLTNKVDDEELQEALINVNHLEETAKQLIELANVRGGEDNITLVIVHHIQSQVEGEAK